VKISRIDSRSPVDIRFALKPASRTKLRVIVEPPTPEVDREVVVGLAKTGSKSKPAQRTLVRTPTASTRTFVPAPRESSPLERSGHGRGDVSGLPPGVRVEDRRQGGSVPDGGKLAPKEMTLRAAREDDMS